MVMVMQGGGDGGAFAKCGVGVMSAMQCTVHVLCCAVLCCAALCCACTALRNRYLPYLPMYLT